MGLVNTWGVIEKGIGAPDYSNTVSSGKERRGILLEYKQRLKIFGRSLNLGGDLEYPLVPSTPLAAGANTHLVDFEDLSPMPFTCPPGYTFTLIAVGYTFSQDAQIYIYIDGGILNVSCLAAVAGGMPVYENAIVGLSTAWLDPTGVLSHDSDVKIYNVGGGNLFGAITVTAILEEIGTEPLPTTKECHCPYCGNKQVESVHATKIKCKNCGREYGVYDLSRVRRTP